MLITCAVLHKKWQSKESIRSCVYFMGTAKRREIQLSWFKNKKRKQIHCPIHLLSFASDFKFQNADVEFENVMFFYNTHGSFAVWW